MLMYWAGLSYWSIIYLCNCILVSVPWSWIKFRKKLRKKERKKERKKGEIRNEGQKEKKYFYVKEVTTSVQLANSKPSKIHSTYWTLASLLRPLLGNLLTAFGAEKSAGGTSDLTCLLPMLSWKIVCGMVYSLEALWWHWGSFFML